MRERIRGLSAAQAKALVDTMAAAFPAIQPLVNAQYPAAIRQGDDTGDKARTLLHRMLISTARTTKEMDTWQTAIDGL